MINPLAAYLNASTLLGILAVAVASQILLAQTAGGENPGPWSPDNGDGTYKNPIISPIIPIPTSSASATTFTAKTRRARRKLKTNVISGCYNLESSTWAV
jgi:hypothetical protein